jgi:nucleotide-binding universal stress UspA family protein
MKVPATDTVSTLKPPLYWRNILVPVDFSAASYSALKTAAGLAEQSGARLTLLHIIHIPCAYPTDALQDTDDLVDSARDSMERMCDGISLNWIRQKIVEIGKQEIFQDIVAAAGELPADLMVITTHGFCGIKRALRGSVAELVVRHAHCPVLVVRGEQELPGCQYSWVT